jgi:uncharacterized delta-60 repeat protein
VLGSALSSVSAAPGDFDATFGSGLGKVLLPIGGRDDYASGLLLLPDRKVLVHGSCQNGTLQTSPYNYCLARLNENGSLDTGFGTNGRVIADFSAINRSSTFAGIPRNIVRLADGRLILAISCLQATNATENRICLVGYQENGALDTSFGIGGYATFDVGGANVLVVDMALQRDGKVVVGAKCQPTSNQTLAYFCIARFLSDGSADANGFGDGGFKITTILSLAEPSGLAIDSEGRAILGGRCRSNSPAQSPFLYCAARYDPNGQLDSTFGTAGTVTHQAGGGGGDAGAGPVLAQPDGKIVIAGRCRPNSMQSNEFCMVRLLSDGSVDNDIGAFGLLFYSGAARGSAITSARFTPDGKYLFGGVCYTSPTNFDGDFCLMRINADGSRDAEFGSNGQVIRAIGNTNDVPSAAAVTSDGKIIVAGGCDGASNAEFCLARFEGGPGTYRACSLDLDGDGRIVATIDGLMQQRVLSGMTGSAVVSGLSFRPSATRTTWAAIRLFLVAQCGMDLPL